MFRVPFDTIVGIGGGFMNEGLASRITIALAVQGTDIVNTRTFLSFVVLFRTLSLSVLSFPVMKSMLPPTDGGQNEVRGKRPMSFSCVAGFHDALVDVRLSEFIRLGWFWFSCLNVPVGISVRWKRGTVTLPDKCNGLQIRPTLVSVCAG